MSIMITELSQPLTYAFNSINSLNLFTEVKKKKLYSEIWVRFN